MPLRDGIRAGAKSTPAGKWSYDSGGDPGLNILDTEDALAMKPSLSFWRTIICCAQVLLLLMGSALAGGCNRGKTEAKPKRNKPAEVQPSEPEAPPSDALRILDYK